MKKRILLMGVAAALVTTALIGGSLAYFQADGRNVQQQISTRTLGISLTDAQSGELPGDYFFWKMPCRVKTLTWKINLW